MKVSILGPAGSYSEIAARTFFETVYGCGIPTFLFCSSIENTALRLFDPDENGNTSDCAVIPIENSIEGAVGVSMDLLLEKDVSIVAELVLPVNHCLLVSEKTAQTPGFSPEIIDVIYSHPQGLYQCRTYIQKHLKNASFIEVDSTSKAAMRIAEMGAEEEGGPANAGGPTDAKIRAAIASAEAGKTYGLKVADCQIQDHLNNSTRFLILIRSKTLQFLKERAFHSHAFDSNVHILPENLSQTGSGSVFYKTSVIVSPLQDKPGALFHILEVFSDYSINLTRIESRPSKKSLGEYNFYIDFEGAPSNQNVADALKLVEKRCLRLKILGTYGRILTGDGGLKQ
ncbi:Bifunctional chorismate mutase/prephenate dehydratase [Methanimicrococcus hongohii]|uniref:prephenate dehydratase n=1 Tax=Methanimicrococcus hongohii TaxID=3028295 RepID=A0AA96ZTA8_9EURY|nr:prephenate dehydratase [Methanimicrococcus sp. Hf6]WNY24335.1 Bifunctional chorismate mutase/prephenate dehydratase [Methanimicrococcus sp. Hf6]